MESDKEIIDYWIDSNVYLKEALPAELESVNTIRLSTAMVELGVAIHKGEPPPALMERLAEVAGVNAAGQDFDELLQLAKEAARQGGG